MTPIPDLQTPSLHKDSALRASWIVASMLLALPLLLRVYIAAVTQPSSLNDVVDFIFDDGYYYLSVAANLVDFGRSTFDGITATNGYQPLWLILLAALARLVGTQPRTLFIASCALICALALAAPLSALLWRKTAARSSAFCIGTGIALVITQQPQVFIQGLEPILIAVIVIPVIITIERTSYDVRTLILLSGLLALTFLMRLDSLSVFISCILCLPLFELVTIGEAFSVRQTAARFLRAGMALSLFVVPVVIVYLAINEWLFGSPVPVSGVAKLIGAPSFSNWGIYGMFFYRWKSVAFIVAILLVLEFAVRRWGRSPRPMFYRSLTIFIVAFLVQSTYYAAFSAWRIWPWYTYLGAIATALLLGRIVYLATLCLGHRRARWLGFAALMMVGVWGANRSITLMVSSLSVEQQSHLGFLRNLRITIASPTADLSANQLNLTMLDEFFPNGLHTLIAMGDRAGGLAFWGREKLSIVQTEGLLLDAAYFKARAANAGANYLEHLPIEYYVVDREVIAELADPQGHTQFVIPDPIQGRVNFAEVPTFCFPPTAVRYKTTYSTYLGVNTRMAFKFADREACSPQSVEFIRSIEQGIGLRQFSLPGEYLVPVDGADKVSEDRDREHARNKVHNGMG